MRKSTAQVQIDGLDETLTIHFRRPSGQLLAEMQATDDEQALENLCAALAGVLVEWDLQDDAGEAHPITAQSLMALPVDLLGAITGAITESLGPPTRTSEGSG